MVELIATMRRGSAAEDTASFLQQSAQSGSPVLIPGAWETHEGHPGARPTDSTDPPVTRHSNPAAGFDRERLEREREGGGAPPEQRVPSGSGSGRPILKTQRCRPRLIDRSARRLRLVVTRFPKKDRRVPVSRELLGSASASIHVAGERLYAIGL